MTIRDDMARILRDRGYDNYPDSSELFEELLDDLEEAVSNGLLS